jgi:hypothetical protein
MILKFASVLKGPLVASSSSRKRIIVLQLLINQLRLERFLLQNFKLNPSFFNFDDMFLVEFPFVLVLLQLSSAESRNPSCSTQKFSNLKIVLLGILVLITILQGI